jgi:hypothetical protein
MLYSVLPAPPYRARAWVHIARRFAEEARSDPTAGAPPRPAPRRHDAAPSSLHPLRIVLSLLFLLILLVVRVLHRSEPP